MFNDKYLSDIIEKAADYEDGETGVDRCIELYCEDHGVSEEDCNRAKRQAFYQGSIEAGIPKQIVLDHLNGVKSKAKLPLNLADIEITDMSNLQPPRFVDCMVESAYWKSTGRDLTDSEIERLQDEHSDFVHEAAVAYFY